MRLSDLFRPRRDEEPEKRGEKPETTVRSQEESPRGRRVEPVQVAVSDGKGGLLEL